MGRFSILGELFLSTILTKQQKWQKNPTLAEYMPCYLVFTLRLVNPTKHLMSQVQDCELQSKQTNYIRSSPYGDRYMFIRLQFVLNI